MTAHFGGGVNDQVLVVPLGLKELDMRGSRSC